MLIGLLGGSLLVTALLAALAMRRARHFSRLLRHGDFEHFRGKQIVDTEAARMRIRHPPRVCVVDARVSPMLWFHNRRLNMVLPKAMVQGQLDDGQLQCIVRHELAHQIRRDNWSNLLVCFIAWIFWWNPVVWLARRELTLAQEASCDAFVLQSDPSKRRLYAETLMHVIEFIAPIATCSDLHRVWRIDLPKEEI